MKKFFQTEWHKIIFNTFTDSREDKLADIDFYKKFYHKFFNRYKSIDELDSNWVKLKKDISILIMNHTDPKSKILSIGCGLGIIEKEMQNNNYSNIFLTEVSDLSLKWVSDHFKGKIFIGEFPNCIPENMIFDTILLVGVDYFFNDNELHNFLLNVKKLLNEKGKCIFISWSFYGENLLSFVKNFIRNQINYSIKLIHRPIKFRKKQFWGYLRTPKEYKKAFSYAGIEIIRDGIYDSYPKWKAYWIVASNN